MSSEIYGRHVQFITEPPNPIFTSTNSEPKDHRKTVVRATSVGNT